MKYIDETRCQIARLDGKVILMDQEGNEIWFFSSTWSDEQITTAIRLANNVYRDGYEIGKRDKLNEIRRALELELAS